MASTGLADFATDGVDVAVRYGRGVYPGLRSDFLMSGACFVVCSPALAADSGRRLETPGDLRHPVLLHDELDLAGGLPELNWARWHAGVGGAGRAAHRGHRSAFSHLAPPAAA